MAERDSAEQYARRAREGIDPAAPPDCAYPLCEAANASACCGWKSRKQGLSDRAREQWRYDNWVAGNRGHGPDRGDPPVPGTADPE